MSRGDRVVVLQTEQRGEIVDLTRDGRLLVRHDDDLEVALAYHPHELELVARCVGVAL